MHNICWENNITAATVDYTDATKELSLCVYILIKEPVLRLCKADIWCDASIPLRHYTGTQTISYHIKFPESETLWAMIIHKTLHLYIT